MLNRHRAVSRSSLVRCLGLFVLMASVSGQAVGAGIDQRLSSQERGDRVRFVLEHIEDWMAADEEGGAIHACMIAFNGGDDRALNALYAMARYRAVLDARRSMIEGHVDEHGRESTRFMRELREQYAAGEEGQAPGQVLMDAVNGMREASAYCQDKAGF